jgi:RNA recognition motif-containing protein
VTDKLKMCTKGYEFVKFGDPTEQARAMTEMNGMPCSSRPMCIGPAANRKNTGGVVQER